MAMQNDEADIPIHNHNDGPINADPFPVSPITASPPESSPPPESETQNEPPSPTSTPSGAICGAVSDSITHVTKGSSDSLLPSLPLPPPPPSTFITPPVIRKATTSTRANPKAPTTAPTTTDIATQATTTTKSASGAGKGAQNIKIEAKIESPNTYWTIVLQKDVPSAPNTPNNDFEKSQSVDSFSMPHTPNVRSFHLPPLSSNMNDYHDAENKRRKSSLPACHSLLHPNPYQQALHGIDNEDDEYPAQARALLRFVRIPAAPASTNDFMYYYSSSTSVALGQRNTHHTPHTRITKQPPRGRRRKNPLDRPKALENPTAASTTTTTTTARRSTTTKRSNPPAKRYACPTCTVTFPQRSSMRNHIRTVHDRCRPFRCPREGCAAVFGARGDVTRHVNSVHDGRRPFHCTECGAFFARRSVLVRHRVNLHEKRGKERKESNTSKE